MATANDGPNFANTYDYAAWNPALRPDSTEPQEASAFSATPSKEVVVVAPSSSSDQHGSLTSATSRSHLPVLISPPSHHLENTTPTSDNDFFDRNGCVAENLVDERFPEHRESVHVEDSRQESSTAHQVADPGPTNIDWDNIDDTFDIGVDKEQTAASATLPELLSGPTSSNLRKETSEPTN